MCSSLATQQLTSLYIPLFNCRESNPEIQQWMKEHNYTDYSKLEQYYETTYVRRTAHNLAKIPVINAMQQTTKLRYNHIMGETIQVLYFMLKCSGSPQLLI